MRKLTLIISYLILAACNGGSSGGESLPPPPPPAPAAPTVNIEVGLKQLIFNWEEIAGADSYRLLENPDSHSGFTQVGDDIPSGTLSAILPIAVHFQDFTNALYMVEACNVTGCNGSTEVHAMNGMLDAIGYFKASNHGWCEFERGCNVFGGSLSLSDDGSTLAVGASGEWSSATGINGDQSDNSAFRSGAVYVFRFNGTAWSQQAYVKASNTGASDGFGGTVTLSADGSTLVVGAGGEDSSATGINGDQGDNTASGSGAVYVFRFDGTAWSQQAYVKASNTESNDSFGYAISLSADGDTLAVGATGEDSNATGINGDQDDETIDFSSGPGAVYLFRFDGMDWSQQAYVKASNTGLDSFADSVALSADGNTLVVGARGEDSSATGINGDQGDNTASGSGAVYVFRFDGTAWSQQAYVKASNTGAGDSFGYTISLSADGDTLAVGASGEDSNATGINSDQSDNSFRIAGAVYVFRFDGTAWSQQAYIKASNTGAGDSFGHTVTLSADGNTLAVVAYAESSNAIGIAGDQNDNSVPIAGAVYVFQFDGTAWSQQAYVKASNTGPNDSFGSHAVALSADGTALAVGALFEDSNATGINGDQNDNSFDDAGAVYLY